MDHVRFDIDWQDLANIKTHDIWEIVQLVCYESRLYLPIGLPIGRYKMEAYIRRGRFAV